MSGGLTTAHERYSIKKLLALRPSGQHNLQFRQAQRLPHQQ
jgi:hypothetical protein